MTSLNFLNSARGKIALSILFSLLSYAGPSPLALLKIELNNLNLQGKFVKFVTLFILYYVIVSVFNILLKKIYLKK